MYLLIIFLPFISCFLNLLFGRFFGKKGAQIIILFCMGLSTLLSYFIFYEIVLANSIVNIQLFNWINSGLISLPWGFLFDSLTATMLIIVYTVSFLVHLYSISYMENDPHIIRFLSYLSLFTFMMIMLITADNYLQLFLGWEGVGLASYLLINFWYTRLQANKSALKAIIVNRIGDFGLGLAIMAIFFTFKSLNFNTIFSIVYLFKDYNIIFFNMNFNIINIICFLLFLGVIGKSAQLGLHTWLPDAMEGPTPVSALIHAATMVTAGVFLILRSSFLFEYSPNILFLLTIFGGLTSFFAATTGLFQNDLKKIIAYSTCSQLGYMVFACGFSNYNISLFHLMNHAFFKALLFLSAGAIIHTLNDEQDLRKFGGLYKLLPFTYIMFLIGSLSLAGFPFLTGFYSKDIILEATFANININNIFIYWLGTLSAFITAAYSFRLIYFTFLTKYNGFKSLINYIHDVNYIIFIALSILSLGSIFVGYFFKDMFIGLGSPIFNNVLYILPEHIKILESEYNSTLIKLTPVIFSIIGMSLIYIILNNFNFHNNFIKFIHLNINLYIFLNRKWLFDYIYNQIIVKYILQFSYYVTFKYLDRGIIELIGPLGIINIFRNIIIKIIKLQSGYIYHYILIMILGIILLISLIILNNYLFLFFDYKFYLILIILFFFNFIEKTNK